MYPTCVNINPLAINRIMDLDTGISGAVDIISDLELENILNSVHESSLEQIGGKLWVEQMSMMEELNIQAALEARYGKSHTVKLGFYLHVYRLGGEERVRDLLVENEKLSLIVHEVLLIELWRKEIMTR